MRKERVVPQEELTYLANYQPKNYEKPSLTADILLLSMIQQKLHVLLVKRGGHPFKGYWALPGGFVGTKESIEEAAYRELKEETGVEQVYLEQLATFSEVDRDPRMRVISVAHLALIKAEDVIVKAGDDAIDAKWFVVDSLLDSLKIEDIVAFDHEQIIKLAMKRLKGKAYYTNVLFALLPDEFTIGELRNVFEEVFHKELHAPNFRREMLPRLIATGKTVRVEGVKRPSELYRMNPDYFEEEDENNEK